MYQNRYHTYHIPDDDVEVMSEKQHEEAVSKRLFRYLRIQVQNLSRQQQCTMNLRYHDQWDHWYYWEMMLDSP